MLEDLRIVLSQRIIQSLGVDLNRYPEKLFFDYFQQIFARPAMLYLSGSGMRLSPDHIFLTAGYNLFLLITSLITFILMVCTVFFLSLDFSQLIIVGLLVVLKLVGMTAHIYFSYKRREVLQVIDIMMALHGKYFDDVPTSDISLWIFFKSYWAPLTCCCWGVFMVAVPVYRYFVLSDAFFLPFPMWFPFETQNLLGFLVAFFFQILSIYCFCVQAITLIPIFFYITMRLVKESQNLIDSLQSIHKDTVDEFQRYMRIQVCARSTKSIFALYRDPEFAACLNKRMHQIVDRHVLILKCVDTLQSANGVPLAALLGLGAFFVGFSLCYLVSDSDDVFNKIAIAIITVINTVIGATICSVGQRITDMGENMREELYFVNWYDWPEPMKRSLRIMLARTMNPPTISAAYVDIKANYETFATILNSAYSFLNMLLAFKK